MELALGLIETRGLIAAVEAADAMTKTAEVHLIGYEVSTGGLICVKIVGEVAAVKSAVEEASNRAARIGELVSIHVIPRPDVDIETIIHEVTDPGSEEGVQYNYDAMDLDSLSVTDLRKIARETKGIGIKGREISKANKDKLIEAIKKVTT
jgi:ethanolamine utilization protein EutM